MTRNDTGQYEVMDENSTETPHQFDGFSTQISRKSKKLTSPQDRATTTRISELGQDAFKFLPIEIATVNKQVSEASEAWATATHR